MGKKKGKKDAEISSHPQHHHHYKRRVSSKDKEFSYDEIAESSAPPVIFNGTFSF